MAVWAIADLHLSFGVPNKSMEVFGPQWENWTEKVKNNWIHSIKDEDLVLIAGDISWATHIKEVVPDLEWIHQLPGTKVLLRGNHDYWWHSLKKIGEVLPSSMHLIQNNVFDWHGISIGGARMWDTDEYSFMDYIEIIEDRNEGQTKPMEMPLQDKQEEKKLFQRELDRLELSLKSLDKKAKVRIAMTHYPPIGSELQPSQASVILEKYNVDICVFGHLHNIRNNTLPFGKANNIQYVLTACDYLNFQPVQIL